MHIKCYVWVSFNATEKKYTLHVCKICWDISQHFTMSILCLSLFHWSNEWVQRCWGRQCQDRPQPNLLPAAKCTSGHRQKRSADAQHARRINRDNSIHANVGIEPSLPSLCQCMLACWWYLYIFVWITFNDCSVGFSEQVVWFSPGFSLRHLVFICSAFLFGRCRLNDPWFFTIE